MPFFRKTRPGRMGVLTVPQGTPIYEKDSDSMMPARKEFDVLALPTTRNGCEAYSIKIGDRFHYVFRQDVAARYTGD